MQYCVTCHKADLVGIDGAMKGDSFMERRREDSLATTASLVIEDSERGLKASMEAGIRCIIVPNEFTRRSNFAGAYKVAENLTDLLKELRMKTEN
jgi:beta-phosphoglucomutase-like phosphatase (HAD superfamily)